MRKHCLFSASTKLDYRRYAHTFSFSPTPHRRPTALRSTTGPRSRSKLHTTISVTHRCIRLQTSSFTSGGGLGSPGRRDQPSRILGVRLVADDGPRAEGLVERSTDGTRILSDLERVKEPEEEVRRFGIRGVGVDWGSSARPWEELGTAEEGRADPDDQGLEPASGVVGSSSSFSDTD
jgi:hypothetical protein